MSTAECGRQHRGKTHWPELHPEGVWPRQLLSQGTSSHHSCFLPPLRQDHNCQDRRQRFERTSGRMTGLKPQRARQPVAGMRERGLRLPFPACKARPFLPQWPSALPTSCTLAVAQGPGSLSLPNDQKEASVDPPTTGWPTASSNPHAQSSQVQAGAFSEGTGRTKRLDESGQETPEGRRGSLGLTPPGLYQQPALQGHTRPISQETQVRSQQVAQTSQRAGTIKAALDVQLAQGVRHQLLRREGGRDLETQTRPHPWARRVGRGDPGAFLTLVPLLTSLAPRTPMRATTTHPTEHQSEKTLPVHL